MSAFRVARIGQVVAIHCALRLEVVGMGEDSQELRVLYVRCPMGQRYKVFVRPTSVRLAWLNPADVHCLPR